MMVIAAMKKRAELLTSSVRRAVLHCAVSRANDWESIINSMNNQYQMIVTATSEGGIGGS